MAYTALSAAVAGTLINAAWMNTYLRDNINALNGNGVIPAYAILIWPGLESTIPDNWLPCNGAAGVQDLRDRAIIGAGSTYAVHDTGGSATAAQAEHTAHSISAPAHTGHPIVAATTHPIALGGTGVTVGAQANVDDGTHASGTSDTSAHSGQALTLGHSHTGSPYSILPPYRALTYALKATPTLSVGTPRTWADGDVPTAAMFNADLRDAIMALRQRMIWPTMGIMWSGVLTSLPTGYSLCDGTNSTSDMRDRFLLGAGASYALNATGGATTLPLPNHANHTVTQASAHIDHTALVLAGHTAATILQAGGTMDETTDVLPHLMTFSAHAAHSGFGVDAHGTHADITTIPPYIALGYIQLTSVSAYTPPRTWADGEIVDASRINTFLRDNEAALYTEQVPIGAIFPWHESIASIPANYAHCNGSGGRVDTRDRLAVGAGSTYAVTATGGATSSTPSTHVAHVPSYANAHGNHSITQPPDHALAGVQTGFAGTHPGNTNWSHNFSITGGGGTEHVHTGWTIDSGAAHAAHSAMSLLPPYHALAFIQRVS